MNEIVKKELYTIVELNRPIIYIEQTDFHMVNKAIKNIAKKLEEENNESVKCYEFNNALGLLNFKTQSTMDNNVTLENFLQNTIDDGYDDTVFIVLKDIHDQLSDPKIISLLKRIAEKMIYGKEYATTVFILDSKIVLPREIEPYITVFDVPLPDDQDIVDQIKAFINENEVDADESIIEGLVQSFKGMNEFQIRQILDKAYQIGGRLELADKNLVLKEKQQFIKKSGMLELVNFKESIESIGGLENLKEWLKRKSIVFDDLIGAKKFGVDMPKGIMIVGMPGCGKSLTAKATSVLFNLPLVRLDVGRLLGKYVGESEENMRKALLIAESISPCVLWIDEVEKAFAGIGSGSGNEVTTRLFGQFLTWMQEKENTVFIVATANDISCLPPEFLRKGRFDEIFFVGLPEEDERKRIIEIHLNRRNRNSNSIDLSILAKQTVGFNGADIESVIKETIEESFVNKKTLITTDDLLKTIKETKSISQTMKHRIESINEYVKKHQIKSASKK